MTVAIPDWLEPLYDAARMRAMDAWAIREHGVPGLDLMERAGKGLARLVVDVAPAGPVAVVCGGGNNGGDGYVVARLLHGQGREVCALRLGDPSRLAGDARVNHDRLRDLAPSLVRPFQAGALEGAAVIVDAVLGTGFSGRPREDAAAAIAAINAADAPVVACDVPSGVDASTGAVTGEAVKALATATFAAPKLGLWIHPGKACAGEVVAVDIGIPQGAPRDTAIGLITDRALAAYPHRGAESTKFASGHVLVAGGSRGLTGAVCLAASAAMRAGAGYVTACVPASLNDIFEVKLTEVMSAPLPDADGAHTPDGAQEVLERARQRGGVLIAGPGLGRADGAFAFVRRVVLRAGAPVVLDADGLNAFAGDLDGLRRRSAPTILTPHAGELGRLLGVAAGEVAARRLWHAQEAARRSDAIVVLKGDDTIVAEPEGRIGVSRGGSPALATAGTGDVLSGVLGALVARGMVPWEAACAGVFVHAEAGRRAAVLLDGPDGVIASDVVDELPHVLR